LTAPTGGTRLAVDKSLKALHRYNLAFSSNLHNQKKAKTFQIPHSPENGKTQERSGRARIDRRAHHEQHGRVQHRREMQERLDN